MTTSSSVHVRLDSQTAERLDALVRLLDRLAEHYGGVQRKTTASDVLRAGIDALYEKHVTASESAHEDEAR